MAWRLPGFGESVVAPALRRRRQAAVEKPHEVYMPIPGFDSTSIDTSVDPCTDFYKFACGKFAANHPIPADQAGGGPVLRALQRQYAVAEWDSDEGFGGWSGTVTDEQKIGDYYKAAWIRTPIEAKGLAPVKPLLDEIDALTEQEQLPALIGKLQRMGVDCLLRVWRAAGLQGREQADCVCRPGRTGPAGAGLLPAHRRARTRRCGSSMWRTWRRC